MKTIKTSLIILILVLLAPISTSAQKMYRIHEDVVKPSHVVEYESVVGELLAMVKKHNLQDVKWITSVTNDSRYMFISSMENYAELDKPNFVSALIEKEGKEKIYDLFD